MRSILMAGLLLGASATSAMAVPYYYVDWTSANPGAGTAGGKITLPDASVVNVGFAATYAGGAPGSFLGAQLSGVGFNYWSPASTWIGGQVSNAPPTPDLLQLVGGQNQIYTVTLSAPIKDPIMSILSLGSGGNPITYDFDSPFTIVASGPSSSWGGSTATLTQLPDNVLQGNEGNGTIQFIGTYSVFSWTVPTPEYWHGFTFGIRTTEALEPTPPTNPNNGAIPEPATMGLASLALLAVGATAWRRR